MVRLKTYERLYAWFGLGILLLSTLVWSINGARIQQGNSDQLVSGYLFEDGNTLSGAIFPASHTQLIKWPLFAFLRIFDFSASSFVVLTVLVSLATVGALAYLMYRANKEALVFGTLCLALALVLTLIPAQIFNSVTAPLSMAMISGRNLEYIVYIVGLWLCIKTPRFKSWQFLLATALMGLLVASDHLFFFISLAAAAAFLGVSWLANHRLVDTAKYWLSVTALAWPIAALIQAAIGQLTNIFNDAPPYGLSKNWHTLQPAITGTAKAVGLNFGISSQAGWLVILPLVFNLIVLAGILLACYRLVKKYLKSGQKISTANTLAIMLVATSIVAILAFIISNQPYVSDARYLSVILFSGFLILATYSQQLHLKPRKSLIVGFLATIAIIFGLAGTWRHTNQVLAADQLRQRNARIAVALNAHHEQYLVGNYWRVFPIKLMSKNNQAVVPLDNCLSFTQILGSRAWRPDLRTHSFAYILSVRSSGIAAPSCFERTIELKYGPPSSKTVIAGPAAHPTELLLFYDDGSLDR